MKPLGASDRKIPVGPPRSLEAEVVVFSQTMWRVLDRMETSFSLWECTVPCRLMAPSAPVPIPLEVPLEVGIHLHFTPSPQDELRPGASFQLVFGGRAFARGKVLSC